MCGTALRGDASPAPKGARTKTAPLTVGGYSILGLSQEPIQSAASATEIQQDSSQNGDAQRTNSQPTDSPRTESRPTDSQPADSQQNDLLNRNLDYLFEDDDKKCRPHWRMYLALLLLVTAAGTLVWQWQRNGYPWNDLSLLTNVNNPGTATALPAAAHTTPVSATPEEAAKPDGGLASGPAKSEVTKTEAKKAPQLQPTPAAPTIAATAPSETADSDPARSDNASAALDTTVQKPARHVAQATNSPGQPAAAQAASPAEVVQLLTEGTKYLLGDGVAQDCDRAQKDLRVAARYSSDAESMLGTMYASGHCVGRDLPTAYRWYARALHSKPGNSRTENDLVVLWNQMTPAERKVAAHAEP